LIIIVIAENGKIGKMYAETRQIRQKFKRGINSSKESVEKNVILPNK